MSFNQIVWKMAKANYKKYLFYYLCNSFVVMFFFIFSTVLFNKHVVAELSKEYGAEPIQAFLTIPGVALIVFIVFFISYAHDIFVKRRKSEFGLFIILGMVNRDIGKLLLIENMFIAFVSLATGILTGMIFSRLIFLLLMSSIGLQEISFHLSGSMFFYTILIFLFVFSIAVGKSLFSILKGDLVYTLKSDQIADSIKWKSPLIGGIGLAVVIGSILAVYYTYLDPVRGVKYLFFWALFTFLGLYLSIYQLTSFVIELAKRNKSFYYRRILFLTSLDYKFKQMTSILTLVTILIMITILYNTINLATYISVERESINLNPYDIAFIQTENKNNLDKEYFYEIVNQKDNPMQEHLVIPIYSHFEKEIEWFITCNFMSLEQFNQLTNNEMKLKDDEYLYYISINPGTNFDGKVHYNINAAKFVNELLPSFTLKQIIVESHINLLPIGYDYIILNNSQLELLKNSLELFEANIHLINVADWKNSSEIVKKLEEEFRKYNEMTPPVEYDSDGDLFRIDSKIETYNRLKGYNGIYFYIITVSSVIFFFGSFIILYLNLFSNIEKEKEKFHKLHLIGIDTKEIKRMISKELTTLFFFPTSIGIIIAFFYIDAMTTEIGGVMKNPLILLLFFIVAGIYHLIQIGFYFYAKRKMFVRVTK